MFKLSGRARKISVLLFWLLLWHSLSLAMHNSILLVGPIDTLKALKGLAALPSFWAAVLTSVWHIMLGFLAAFLSGLITGTLACCLPFVGELLAPAIQLMKSIPVASFIILALIWTGADKLSAFISFLVVYPVIHVNTVSGLGEASQTLLEMARVFRVPLWKKAVYIYLPAVFPYLLSACRTALGMAFKSGIAAEVIGVPDGSIGEGLYLSKIYLSTAELFAWTLTIIAVSLLSEKLFLLLLRAAARMRRMLSAHMPERTETKTDPKTAPGTSADTDIILKDISKWFGQEKILEHFNFIFQAGSAYCLMAPSGTGKTTLLNLLMGLELPDSGTVLGLEGKKISAVFQEDRLLEDCTILENIRFATGRRLTVPEITQEVLRLLPKEALTKPVCEFSGGMKRRAALLRALLTPADLFLMDEPFTGLDREARLAAASLIKEYSRGKLLIVSTHAPDDARLLDAEIVTLNLT